eukprot:TRINITY_DN25031_c0_g1_i2.p1 TRINITY_DN25031_c0_g1~~TRINITY_DN25031_c0_g1_i2.p1  ORF type:complete len:144 (+),score=12.28 TRINITY_DN25031_c0_g1_i2:48-479(+)
MCAHASLRSGGGRHLLQPLRRRQPHSHRRCRGAGGARHRRGCRAGLLAASLIGAVMGSELPGPGSVYFSQSLRFRRPAVAGDLLTARVEVLAVRPATSVVRLSTAVRDSQGNVVLDGEAMGRNTRRRYDTAPGSGNGGESGAL